MTIYDKGLLKAMRAAYRDGGYDVAVTDSGVLIQAEGWGVEVLADAIPNSVKSLIVLHNGKIPRNGSAVHVQKGECADMILDTATATMEALAKGYAVSGGRPIKPTRLTFDGCRLWQAEDNLAVFMVDPDDQQILLGEQWDARLVSDAIYARNPVCSVYVRTQLIEPEDQHLLEHLAEMQWVPVDVA